MKKIAGFIAVYFGSLMVISTAILQIIYIVQIKQDLGVTLNYSYLFFRGNELMTYILLLSSVPCLIYMLTFIRPRGSRNRKNYNKPMSRHQAKKNLLSVTFNDHFYLTLKDRIRITASESTVSILNKMLALMPLSKQQKKDIVKPFKVKSWNIEGKKVYQRSGFPIITSQKRVWLDPSDSHNLVIGTTNSGKTFSILFEMIELTRMAGESAIIVDLKGELSQATFHKFKEDGYQCICIDFIDPAASEEWNPLQLGIDEYFREKKRSQKYIEQTQSMVDNARELYEMKNGTSEGFHFDGLNENGDRICDQYGNIITYENFSKAEEYFSDVANIIFASENADDAHWTSSAKDLFSGLVFYLCENGDQSLINLESVKKLLDIGDTEYRKKTTYLQKALSEKSNSEVSKSKLIGYTEIAENTRKSTKSVFSTRIQRILMNQDVKNMLSRNSIDLKSIGDQKTVVFLKVHDEKSTYYSLVNLFISQVYEVLIASARENADLKLKVPLNLLWDEFGSSPKFEPIMNLLSAGRSRGVRCTMVIQGYDQLESKYGKDGARSIKNNAMNKVYLLSGDESTLKEISDLAGKRQIYIDGKEQDEPIFSTERLSKFQLGEALFIRQRLDPFYTKLLPYNRYRFYSERKTVFETKSRPMCRWFDIEEYIRSKYH